VFLAPVKGSEANIVYVDDSATGAGTGESWADAYTDLQAALAAAVSGDQIWIAAGTYRPDGGSGDRSRSFVLKPGVTIYGGFSGHETVLEERNWQRHRSIFSGDINTPASPIDNSYHVVDASDAGALGVLDGVEIAHGRAESAVVERAKGGGIYSVRDAPVLRNVTLASNYSTLGGGALYAQGRVSLTNCVVRDNRTGQGPGGGLYLKGDAGASCVGCENEIRGSLFASNTASAGGGAIYLTLAQFQVSSLRVVSSTFHENAGQYASHWILVEADGNFNSLTIDNSVLFEDHPTAFAIYWHQHSGAGNQVIARYSNLAFNAIWLEGAGVSKTIDHRVDGDPQFVDAANSDPARRNFHLRESSPCVDAGADGLVPVGQTLDVDGHPRRFDDPFVADKGEGDAPVVDIGAYERNGVIHVDASAAECGNCASNGTSWGNAFADLHDGLEAAEAHEEVWVAAGTYRPSRDSGGDPPADPREATFVLARDVRAYGGFAGFESERRQRDWRANPTVLSGDIGVAGDVTDNAYHVVQAVLPAGPESVTVLDGFIITGGNANAGGGSTEGRGAGLWTNLDLSLVNLVFEGNRAIRGGALAAEAAQSFRSPTVVNTVFRENHASEAGGAVYLGQESEARLVNCAFDGNWVGTAGSGGALYVEGPSQPTLTNGTFHDNAAASAHDVGGYGGAIFATGGVSLAIANSILWGNHALAGHGPQIGLVSSTLLLGPTDLQGALDHVYWGSGSSAGGVMPIDLDPGFSGTSLRLPEGSPCLDAGSNASLPADATDLDGDGNTSEPGPLDLDSGPRVLDDPSVAPSAAVVDLGAYERGGVVRYVDDSAGGAGTGVSWADAFPRLQDALAAARPDDQIWVARGTYRPDRSARVPAGSHRREATFTLKEGVALFGGFAGSETALIQRDWSANPTVLSGDLKGDDGALFANNADNSLHVVTGSGVDASAVLDGFVVRGGNASGVPYPENSGGGLYSYFGSPTVRNTTFIANTAELRGGAMFTQEGSPEVTNAFFLGNAAPYGGAMNNAYNALARVTNAVFSGNQASQMGGAVQNAYGSNVVFLNCTFANNEALIRGGAIRSFASSPSLTNTLLWGNDAPQGPQLALDGGGGASVQYSLLEGGQAAVYVSGSSLSWGSGNVSEDPRLSDAAGADGIPGTADDDLHLLCGSAALDAGTGAVAGLPATDFEGDPRAVDGDGDGAARVDIGADERSASCNGHQDTDGDGVSDDLDNCTELANGTQTDTDADGYGNRCDPDFNNSGLVTAADYLILRARLNSSDALTDLNGDGKVSAADYLILRGWLNKAPGPSGLVP
jgi:predicted outer membrane repeat protein